ncbi:MAG: ABC transporter permease YtrF precursor [Microgenomates bacterium OLB23]|nr:MAG: ABC transporter permease YtrF precursor [Microgenomates bacterium OLB23]
MGKTIGKPTNVLIQRLEALRPFQVRQSYLIYLAFENLQTRKSRTFITVMGMAVGVGIIVYLLSLGYGIERLVINQVASLDELKIIDVSSSRNTALRINNSVVNKIVKNPVVDKIIPLVSFVGRVNFNKAQADVLVYGVSQDYMNIAQIKLKKGKGFTNLTKQSFIIEDGDVAGISTELTKASVGKNVDDEIINFTVVPDELVAVRASCVTTSEIIGYTTRIEGVVTGQRMWGSTYAPYGDYGRVGYDEDKKEYAGMWVRAKLPLFNKDIDNNLVPQIGENGYQVWDYGCIQKEFVQEKGRVEKFASVLGEATTSAALAASGVVATGSAARAYQAEVVATDAAGIEFVKLTSASESAGVKKINEVITFSKKPSGEAIISTGLLRLLGLTEEKALGAKFNVSFILVKALRPDIEGRKFTKEETYKIVGLVDNADEQFFYVPFDDISKLGIKNYSQLKVVVKDKNAVPKIRTEIETYGYTTASSGDTVAEIEGLFRNLRLVLASIGLIALAVASLGMFNTLTVSLLERTREIGGMKVIGMVSEEIQDLFLAEAMIMGFAGGIGGIFLGYLLGQITSFGISIFSVTQGLGYLQVSYIPLSFIVFILLISFVVGILTGLYPARRARNTSALNALRYE